MNHSDPCPICDSPNTFESFVVQDFSVSQEQFMIAECRHCTNRFTVKPPSPENIGPYYAFEDYISHTDTKKGLINALYHRVRNITLESKAKLIQKHASRPIGFLVDVGAGTGAFLHTMQSKGWKTVGFEPDPGARQKALDLYDMTLQLPEALHELPDHSVDVITLWHVLEHVHDLKGYFSTFKRILKPDGLLVIAVPNYTSSDAEHYQQYWAAYDVPRHLYHFSPDGMSFFQKQHAFSVFAYIPMWFDSVYVSLLSEKYRNNGKTHFFQAALNGLYSNFQALLNKKHCSSVIYLSRKF